MTGRHPAPSPILLIGTGSIGSRYLRLLQHDLHRRVLVVPARPERAAILRASGIEAFADIPSALAKQPTAAIIATDTARHLTDVAAVASGVQRILVEKPLGASGGDLTDLRPTVSRDAITVAYCLRFDPGLRIVREQLPKLGRLHTVGIACRSYLPDWRPGRDYREGYAARPDEGGVLRDLSHELDYAVWLFGRPREVACTLAVDGGLGIPVDVSADLQWQTESGTLVTMRLDYLTRPPKRMLHAIGEHGELVWDFMAQTVSWQLDGETPETVRWPQTPDALYLDELRAFLGDDPAKTALATWDEGAFVVALMDAARRSSDTGKTYEIDGGGNR